MNDRKTIASNGSTVSSLSCYAASVFIIVEKKPAADTVFIGTGVCQVLKNNWKEKEIWIYVH